MSLLDNLHGGYVHNRRVRVMCEHLTELLPQRARVLDVGCGDGLLAHLILQRRPDLEIQGIDVLIRPQTYVPVRAYDGNSIPLEKSSFDVVMFVDVLHHVERQMELLAEARRVSRRHLVIKDHTLNGFLAGPTLRFMDWVGNARHGVALTYNYWPRARWLETFAKLKLEVGVWKKDLGLYPPPTDWVFGRSLHFMARLDLPDPGSV